MYIICPLNQLTIPLPGVVEGENLEILTVDELAAMLKINRSQVYELAKERTRSGELREHPLPSLRLGRAVRFRKSDVEAWIEKLAARGLLS
jgi:excisionase family DNA binding protein